MHKTKKTIITGYSAILLVLLAIAIFMGLTMKTVVVRGHSMEPTFHTGDKVLVSSAYWLVGPIRHKDIVVISDDKSKNPDGFMIKRVYKMAGETVDRYNKPRSVALFGQDYVVPDGNVYVLGDNPPESEDSRFYGPVPLNRILGKVVVLKFF